MLILPNRNPVNYALCNQTVTVYHRNGTEYTNTVYRNAFLDSRKNENVEKTGDSESNSFLLVIPCEAEIISAGDKVVRGIGNPVSTAQEWAQLIPTLTPVCVVKYVDYKYWGNQIVHVEAGG